MKNIILRLLRFFTKLLLRLLRFFTEILRWAIIALFIYSIYDSFNRLVIPLVTDETLRQTIRYLLNLAIGAGLIVGIKKIHSFVTLLILLLLSACLLFIQKYIVIRSLQGCEYGRKAI